MNEVKKIDLKIELDKIDQECIEYATDRYYNSRLKLLLGMWGKGKIIGDYTGGKIASWREIERQTERNHEQLKKWYEIYVKYPERINYLKEIAEPKSLEWTQKALTEGKEKQTIVQLFTGNNEWYTPGEFIELARKTMDRIDLDPASSDEAQKTVKAKKYFTIEDNGLDKDWKGNIWLNPPYSGKEIIQFIDKLIDEFQIGNIKQAIVLTNDNTDTSWFHKLAKISSAICFLRGRIKFYNADEKSAPTNGQLFYYIGNNTGQFNTNFKTVGLIMTKYE